jgi:prenyltransferase beta subunit
MVSPLTALAASTRQDVVITFSITCIDSSGGAVLHPGATVPTVSNTFEITNALNTLDAWITADLLLPDRVLIENITAWVEDLQVTSPSTDPSYGGFLPYPNAPNATLTASHFAFHTLDLLNTTASIDNGPLVNFIVNLQRTNATEYPHTLGGFADKATNNATLAATYFALQTLDSLDELSQINQSLVIAWLNASQILTTPTSPSYGGFTNGYEGTTADLQTTFMALRSLEILGQLNIIDQNAARDYILPHYRADTNYPQFFGGFSLTPDDPVATQLATYYAVAGLQILNADSQLSVEEITTWVLNTQTADGGFADVTDHTGFAPQTNFAISTLALLDQLPTLLEPFGLEPYIFPWWIVAAVIIIIIIILFVICARRAEWF